MTIEENQNQVQKVLTDKIIVFESLKQMDKSAEISSLIKNPVQDELIESEESKVPDVTIFKQENSSLFDILNKEKSVKAVDDAITSEFKSYPKDRITVDSIDLLQDISIENKKSGEYTNNSRKITGLNHNGEKTDEIANKIGSNIDMIYVDVDNTKDCFEKTKKLGKMIDDSGLKMKMNDKMVENISKLGMSDTMILDEKAIDNFKNSVDIDKLGSKTEMSDVTVENVNQRLEDDSRKTNRESEERKTPEIIVDLIENYPKCEETGSSFQFSTETISPMEANEVAVVFKENSDEKSLLSSDLEVGNKDSPNTTKNCIKNKIPLPNLDYQVENKSDFLNLHQNTEDSSQKNSPYIQTPNLPVQALNSDQDYDVQTKDTSLKGKLESPRMTLSQEISDLNEDKKLFADKNANDSATEIINKDRKSFLSTRLDQIDQMVYSKEQELINQTTDQSQKTDNMIGVPIKSDIEEEKLMEYISDNVQIFRKSLKRSPYNFDLQDKSPQIAKTEFQSLRKPIIRSPYILTPQISHTNPTKDFKENPSDFILYPEQKPTFTTEKSGSLLNPLEKPTFTHMEYDESVSDIAKSYNLNNHAAQVYPEQHQGKNSPEKTSIKTFKDIQDFKEKELIQQNPPKKSILFSNLEKDQKELDNLLVDGNSKEKINTAFNNILTSFNPDDKLITIQCNPAGGLMGNSKKIQKQPLRSVRSKPSPKASQNCLQINIDIVEAELESDELLEKFSCDASDIMRAPIKEETLNVKTFGGEPASLRLKRQIPKTESLNIIKPKTNKTKLRSVRNPIQKSDNDLDSKDMKKAFLVVLSDIISCILTRKLKNYQIDFLKQLKKVKPNKFEHDFSQTIYMPSLENSLSESLHISSINDIKNIVVISEFNPKIQTADICADNPLSSQEFPTKEISKAMDTIPDKKIDLKKTKEYGIHVNPLEESNMKNEEIDLIADSFGKYNSKSLDILDHSNSKPLKLNEEHEIIIENIYENASPIFIKNSPRNVPKNSQGFEFEMTGQIDIENGVTAVPKLNLSSIFEAKNEEKTKDCQIPLLSDIEMKMKHVFAQRSASILGFILKKIIPKLKLKIPFDMIKDFGSEKHLANKYESLCRLENSLRSQQKDLFIKLRLFLMKSKKMSESFLKPLVIPLKLITSLLKHQLKEKLQFSLQKIFHFKGHSRLRSCITDRSIILSFEHKIQNAINTANYRHAYSSLKYIREACAFSSRFQCKKRSLQNGSKRLLKFFEDSNFNRKKETLSHFWHFIFDAREKQAKLKQNLSLGVSILQHILSPSITVIKSRSFKRLLAYSKTISSLFKILKFINIIQNIDKLNFYEFKKTGFRSISEIVQRQKLQKYLKVDYFFKKIYIKKLTFAFSKWERQNYLDFEKTYKSLAPKNQARMKSNQFSPIGTSSLTSRRSSFYSTRVILPRPKDIHDYINDFNDISRESIEASYISGSSTERTSRISSPKRN